MVRHGRVGIVAACITGLLLSLGMPSILWAQIFDDGDGLVPGSVAVIDDMPAPVPTKPTLVVAAPTIAAPSSVTAPVGVTAQAPEPVEPPPVVITAPARPSPPSPLLRGNDLTGEIELITERYPNGAVRVEREVVLAPSGDYVSNGVYTSFDPQGAISRTGEFRLGQQMGLWTRYFRQGEGSLFSEQLDQQFPGPFVSEAHFIDGTLHGTWVIRDAQQQKIIEWEFEKGKRHGKATWYYPGGNRRCEVYYDKGIPEGEYHEWALDGRPARTVQYIKGRALVKKVENHAPGRKRFEGSYLAAQPSTAPEFDWWNGTVQAGPIQDQELELKHGTWTVWHANGRVKVSGEYKEDLKVGRFTWWYENGQKQAEGKYVDGVQDGEWTTWHPNGMKESRGFYEDGMLAGKWMRWNPDGKLGDVHDFSRESTEERQQAERPDDQEEDDHGTADAYGYQIPLTVPS